MEKQHRREIKLKEHKICDSYKEVGCVSDICKCYTLFHVNDLKEKPYHVMKRISQEMYPIKISFTEVYPMGYDVNEDLRNAFMNSFFIANQFMYSESEIHKALNDCYSSKTVIDNFLAFNQALEKVKGIE